MDTRQRESEREPAAALRSPLGRVANFLNRGVFAQTAVESEFMPELRAYDEMMREASPWQKAVTSAIGGPAAHIWKEAGWAPAMKRTFGAMGRGLKGEDAKFTSQIWADRYGLPETKRGRTGRAVGGFLVDLLRDPPTYADFGMLTKAGRVAKMTGKKAPTVAAQAAAKQRAAIKFMGQPVIYGEKLFEPFTKAAAAIRPTTAGKKAVELFGRGSTNPALSRVLRLIGGRQQELSGEGLKHAWELREMGEQIARKAGRTVDEALPVLGEAIEATTRETVEAFFERELPEAAAEGIEFVAKYRGFMGRELGEQVALGMKIGDLGEGYLKHLFTPEWNKAMKRLESQMPYRAYTELHQSMKERILTRGYTIRQVNEIVRERGIRGLLPELPENANVVLKKAMNDDPAWLAAEYLRGSARARTGAELMNGIKQMDEVVDVAPLRAGREAYEALGGGLVGYKDIVGVKGLEGFAAPIELADEIQRVVGAIVDPATPKQFIRWFDTAQNWWKAWTLAPFPAYHTRNIAGNMWNCFLAGVKDPRVFHDAGRIEMQLWEPTSRFGHWFKQSAQRTLGQAPLDDIAAKYGFGSFDDLATAAHSRGVLGRGWMAAEVPHGGLRARSRVGRALGRESEVVRGGMTVGTIMENNARLGLFLDQTRKNLDLLQGADVAARRAGVIAYHGTGAAGELVPTDRIGVWGSGLYFADNPRLGSTYAIQRAGFEGGANVRKVRLAPRRPLFVGEIAEDGSVRLGSLSAEESAGVIDALQRRGIDVAADAGRGNLTAQGLLAARRGQPIMDNLPPLMRGVDTTAKQAHPLTNDVYRYLERKLRPDLRYDKLWGAPAGADPVRDLLKELGYDAIRTVESGGTALGNQNIWVVLNPGIVNNALTEVPPNLLKLAADDAAITVKKFLFDYTEAGVSQFEQRTLKRLMPFYTWTRNNVPLQLEYLLKKPRKFAAIEKAREAWQHVLGPGPTEKYMPEWKVQGYPWRLWEKGGIPEHLMMERWLPAADIAKVWGPRAIGETAMELGTPFLKLPAELIANYSTYFKRPIEDYGWSQRKLLGIEMDPKLAYTLRQLRPVSELDWLLKGVRGEVTPQATVARALTGKVYPYDWKKERKHRRYELSEEISKLKRQLKRTPRDTRRWRALKKKLDELRQARR